MIQKTPKIIKRWKKHLKNGNSEKKNMSNFLPFSYPFVSFKKNVECWPLKLKKTDFCWKATNFPKNSHFQRNFSICCNLIAWETTGNKYENFEIFRKSDFFRIFFLTPSALEWQLKRCCNFLPLFYTILHYVISDYFLENTILVVVYMWQVTKNDSLFDCDNTRNFFAIFLS